MRRLLVIHHSPTASLARLTAAVIEGAHSDGLEEVEVTSRPALEASADDVLGAAGYVLLTGANFGYMSGGMKVFFDSTFMDVGGSLDPSGAPGQAAGPTARRPYGLLVHGRYDLTGAVRSVRSIVQALDWRLAWPVVESLGDIGSEDLERAHELGATLAAVTIAS